MKGKIIMCYKNEILKPIMNNGRFFDFFPESGHPMIISYRNIDKEIVADKEAGKFIFTDKKKKKELGSIQDLKRAFDELLYVEEGIVNRHGTYNAAIDFENTWLSGVEITPLPFRVGIKPEERELLINQLIFDTLFSNLNYSRPPQNHLKSYHNF